MIGAMIIISLFFGLLVTQARAQVQQEKLLNNIQQIRTDKQTQVKTLSKALEHVKHEKAVTDTQLKKKAATEADLKAQVKKLNHDLQTRAESEVIVASAPVVTGGAGGFSGDTSGNTYDFGYCTWYVKSRRPDIPNSWGNASEWLGNAQAMGWATGSVPKSGAIGQTSGGSLGHVVYVEGVNGDGTVSISEMNYQGWNIRSTRVVGAAAFTYIY